MTIVREQLERGVVRGDWFHRLDAERLQCDLCPRYCKLHEGQRGFCYVREARGGKMVLTSYGRAIGLTVDPVEKKPLHHFYPGTGALSFGTAGCNLGCQFCQNWEISKARDDHMLSSLAGPNRIADVAVEEGCTSVAFTYNDPIVFAEYAIDTARAAHDRGLKTIAVTNGYITPEARRAFFEHMDATNIDLKAFTERFYHHLCYAHLDPVLDTLQWVHRETDVWLEVTTLLIPGQNDSVDEISQLCDWFLDALGPDVPLHFTAFRPDFRMRDVPPTRHETLRRARLQAKSAGITHVYVGNVSDIEAQTTWCDSCGEELIRRDGYSVLSWNLDGSSCCLFCGAPLVGRFDKQPGALRGRRRTLELLQEHA
jgi:pyruvate formate lyase activating enzyme